MATPKITMPTTYGVDDPAGGGGAVDVGAVLGLPPAAAPPVLEPEAPPFALLDFANFGARFVRECGVTLRRTAIRATS
jgi:hypothetical protein